MTGQHEKPTLLMVGSGEPMDAALRLALDRHGLAVETCPGATALESVLSSAPDLLLLIGDAAAAGGQELLRHLSENPATAVVPVALLADDTSLDERLKAFRHGAVAVVPRGASADAVGKRVAELATELPERLGEATGELGEVTLDELMKLVGKELRSGILSVAPAASGGEEDALRLVFGAGRPVAEALSEFVERLRPLVNEAEPMRYELLEEPGGRIGLLRDGSGGTSGDDMGSVHVFAGLRILVVDDDPSRADTLAQELRACGSMVVVSDTKGSGLERARELDPDVVIVDSAGMHGPGFEVVRVLRRDPRLRWASMLVASWSEIWPPGHPTPSLEKLAGRVGPMVEHDRKLAERASTETKFETRLEVIGPSRMLRALAAIEAPIHLTARSPKALVEVDVGHGLVVGASATAVGTLQGPLALAALLALSSGRVRVERKENPSVTNIMTPVDQAIAVAALESPALLPSAPPGAPSAPPAPAWKPPPPASVSTAKEGKAKLTDDLSQAGFFPPDQASGPPTPDTKPDGSFANEAPTTEIEPVPEADGFGEAEPTRIDAQPVGVESPLGDTTLVDKPVQKPHQRTLMGVPAAQVPMPPPPPAGAAPPPPAPGSPAKPVPPGAAPPPPPAMSMAAVLEKSKHTSDPSEGREPSDDTVRVETPPLSEAPVQVIAPSDETRPSPDPAEVAPVTEGARPKKRSLTLLAALVGFVVLGVAVGAGILLFTGDGDLMASLGGLVSGQPDSSRVAPDMASPPPTPAGDPLPEAAGPASSEADGPTAEATDPDTAPPPDIAPPPEGPVLADGDPGLDVEEVAEGADPSEASEATTPREAAEEAPPDPVAEVVEPAEEPTEPVAEIEPPSEEPVEAIPPEPPPAEEPPAPRAAPPAATPSSIDPSRSVDSLVNEAEALARRGDMDGASPLFERAYELDPRDNHAVAGMAQVFIARGNAERALELAQEAVRMRGRRASYRVVLGDAHALAGDEEAARAAYRRALRLEPGYLPARQRLRR